MDVVNSPPDKEKNTVLIKILGWILLIAGVAVIGWALISSYNIFTGKKDSPEIFKIEVRESSPVAPETVPTIPEEIQKEMEKLMEEQLKDILPADFLPRTLNLTAWSILAFIFIFGGAQISGIGIKLIRPVK